MYFNDPELIKALTPEWTGERLPDGRPKVADSVLERLRNITFEEAWGPIFMKGYKASWECNFRTTNPGLKLVGRAVTCTMMPNRPDLDGALRAIGKEQGYVGNYNQWVIDSLGDNDVVVVDLFDKVLYGTFVGGNLSTAIRTRTNKGGLVVWGGIRDYEQICDIEGLQVYFRGNDPTGIADVLMTGFNTPTRIGGATCMPGDVVLGTTAGIIFIPAHLAEEVADDAEKSHIRDVFGFDRLASGTYNTAQIDRRWTRAIFEDFLEWFKTDERAQKYSYLNWDKELQETIARENEEMNPAEVAL